MKQIEVHSQAELNAIPDDYDGQIIVKFGTAADPAIIDRRWKHTVRASDNATVRASDNATVDASGNATVDASGNATVEAWDNVTVDAWDNVTVDAWDNVTVEAWGNATVRAWGNATVEAWGNATVDAWGNATVEAWDNATVDAWGNCQIVDRTATHKLATRGNARVVYLPRTGAEYADYYALDVSDDGTAARLYKAVHKRNGRYWADWTDFEYIPGTDAVASGLNTDPSKDCGQGIHMSYLDWALRYGEAWPDLAILELEANVDGLIVHTDGSGKVRAATAKVIREVPLEECGVLGKILMRRRAND